MLILLQQVEFTTAEDVIKMVMAGAKVTQMLSALLKFGIGHIADVTTNLKLLDGRKRIRIN